jgi:hypothetical protein
MGFSESIKEKVKERAHFKCCLCHKNWVMDVHHITPASEGGPDTEENAAPLCANCHDLYGGNPDKRKFIEQSRDFWYDYCERESSPQYIAQLREMFDKLDQRVATKDDLHKAVAYLEDRMQNIMNQPLSTSKQVQMIADTTAAFSNLVVFRWPQKGDNPFLVKAREPNSPTWAALDWLAAPLKISDSFLARAFKEAGDKIIKDLARSNTREHGEKFFHPIAFLYRHSLELKMKEVVRLGIELELIPCDEKASAILKDHNLHQLWNLAKKAIKAFWPKGPEDEINNAEKIILAFHEIDSAGQALRYTKDNSGKSYLDNLPESVHLTHVRDVFEAIFNFLNGCELGLSDAIDRRNEMA